MSENKRQFETDIVINEKSQGTVAGHLRFFVGCSITVYWKFNVESDCERILKSVNIWLRYRQESWLSHVLCAPRHCPAKRWTRQRSQVQQETCSCCIDFYLAYTIIKLV